MEIWSWKMSSVFLNYNSTDTRKIFCRHDTSIRFKYYNYSNLVVQYRVNSYFNIFLYFNRFLSYTRVYILVMRHDTPIHSKLSYILLYGKGY